MLNNLNLENVLFLDIETVPAYSEYENAPETEQKLWDKKSIYLAKEDQTSAEIYERAGIYAEFGKIICISVGFMKLIEGGGNQFRIKSFYGDDEKITLQGFIELLNNHFNSPNHFLCGHNGKEFDFPYLSRRILINRLKLPYLLNNHGKKPWEVTHIDTMELWKFGDFKHYTSLNLLTYLFDIPTPKDDIDGSDIAHVYYDLNDLERIRNYCQKDVLALAQLLLSYMGEPLINDDEVIYVD